MTTSGRNMSPVDVVSNLTDAATSTDEETADISHEQVVGITQAPVFNIHIHVPRNREGNTTMYLPRIQPIIHIHFDELAKTLRKNKVHKDRNFRVLRSALNQSTPKFGSVSMHYEDISHNRSFNSDNVNISGQITEKRQGTISNIASVTDEKSVTNEMKSCRSTSSHGNSPKRGQSSTKSHNSNSNSNKLSTEGYHCDPSVKLKEAVVVLKDICKSKAYKDGVFFGLKSAKQENKVLDGSSNSEFHDHVNSEQIKRENTSTSYGSLQSPLNEEAHELSKGDALSSRTEDMKQFEAASAEFGESRNMSKKESLAAMLDGCNFSELINRFREKREYIVSSVKKSEVGEDENKSENERSLQKDCVNERIDIITVKDEPNDVSEDDAEENWEEEEVEESKSNLQRTVSSEVDPHLPQSPRKRKLDAGELDMYDSNKSTTHTHQELSGMIGPNGDSVQVKLTRSSISEGDSDSDNTVSSSESNSELVGELNSTDFDSINTATVNKSQFDYVDTDNLGDICKEYESTDSELSEKELNMTKRRNRAKDSALQKDTPENATECSPLAKKSKRSPTTTMKFVQKAVKSRVDDGYIPLNSSGPTKFSVATLTDVQPYKTHNAKNFKDEMLYGNRVRRFPDSNHLQMYKMKKKASPGKQPN